MSELIEVKARAVREGRWWVLQIAEGGTTQARTLTQAEAMIADYVGLTREIPAENVRVTLTDIDPGDGFSDELAAARKAQAEALLAQETAAAKIRALAKTLRERGLSGAEVALVLGVSKQRVSQLTAMPTAAIPTAGQPPATNGRSALTPRSA